MEHAPHAARGRRHPGDGADIAVAGHGRNGFWNHNVPPGWEYPMVLGVVAAGIGISGPGRHGIDASLELPLTG